MTQTPETQARRTFPILSSSIRNLPWLPCSVPWDAISCAGAQAVRNHSQSLERLAERGGLSPDELWCAYNEKDLRAIRTMTPDDHIEALKLIVDLNRPTAEEISNVRE